MSSLPNMGIQEGMVRPIDMDHLYKDPGSGTSLLMYITIVRTNSRSQRPKDNHWSLDWEVGRTSQNYPVVRRMQIHQEIGSCHLTNWGPMTKFSDDTARGLKVEKIPVAELSWVQRMRIEKVAAQTKVKVPDGAWNCQDWLEEVLNTACSQGLLLRKDMQRALDRAHDAVLPM